MAISALRWQSWVAVTGHVAYKARNIYCLQKKFADPYLEALTFRVWPQDREHQRRL